MPSLESIQQFSRRLRIGLLVTLCATPVVSILYWAWFGPNLPGELAVFVEQPISMSSRFSGFLVDLLPLGLFMAGTFTLMRMFGRYERGDVFSAAHSRAFRNLGRLLLAWFLLSPVHDALLALALTWTNPPGSRAITIELTTANLTALFAGLALIVIAKVMALAAEMAEEQRLTV